jgi:hypothetical protein
MRESLPTRLLLQLMHAPAEKLAAVERILSGEPVPDPRHASATASSGSSRFGLNRGEGAWLLTYDGKQVAFCDRAGMDLVDYLLKHPHEPIHPVTLLAWVHGEAPLQQRSSAFDDAEATRRHLREMERLREVIESDEASAAEKQSAEEELAELERSVADIHHRTMDGASRTARSVRQAIRRACASLAEAGDEQRRPHPVLSAFAAHLRAYLLAPSQSGSNGHLVYEAPPGVVWE